MKEKLEPDEVKIPIFNKKTFLIYTIFEFIRWNGLGTWALFSLFYQ